MTSDRGHEVLGEFIARSMGYKYCVLFPRARDALREFCALGYHDIALPTNICPVASTANPTARMVPVDPYTGLASLPVQLYGYRNRERQGLLDPDQLHALDLDPLMTGWYDKPLATSSIVSFGRHKIVNTGGGAFLTQDWELAEEMAEYEYFPRGLVAPLGEALLNLPETVEKRFERIALWDRLLGDCCTRIPGEQVMPWRVMRRIPGGISLATDLSRRDVAVRALRNAGIAVGTNYQPLPGVTDQGSIQWGNEVINFLLEGPDCEDMGPDYADYVLLAAETIKRVIG